MKRMKWFYPLCVLLSVLLLVGCANSGVAPDTESGTPKDTEPQSTPETLFPAHLEEIGADIVPGALDGTEEGGFVLSDLTASDGKRFYVVKSAAAAPTAEDWNSTRALKLWTYQWRDNGYEPDVYAQMLFVPGDGFYVRMTCFEVDPYYKATTYLGSVWDDSCMEFFADWFGTGNYTNMEVNAYGASYQGYGVSMEDRIKLAAPLAEATAEILSDRWTVDLRIPLSDLAHVVGGDTSLFAPGYLFTGNFYKCGSKTEYPHYGMWNTIDHDVANFHLSQFFGYLYIA